VTVNNAAVTIADSSNVAAIKNDVCLYIAFVITKKYIYVF
jgi:hypothetical protein